MPGKVGVKIKAGRNLPVMDRSSDTTDAYVEIKLGNVTQKTDVCRKSLNPQWNTDWYRFELDDAELQDEPLQIRLMDHDTYSANDAIGKVNISLNPLCLQNSNFPSHGKGLVMSGWIPVFDTMHGIRGEVNVIVKVDLFSDANKFRQSSCGVQFFHSPNIPDGYRAQVIHGFVEELVVNDDPEYQWIDKIRTPRASNEARQVVFLQLSGQVQRKIGLKAINLGANAVIGYTQCFDLEGDVGVVARGIGTAVTLVKIQEAPQLPIQDNALIEEPVVEYLRSMESGVRKGSVSKFDAESSSSSSNDIVSKILGLDTTDKAATSFVLSKKWQDNESKIKEMNENVEMREMQALFDQEDQRNEKPKRYFRQRVQNLKQSSKSIFGDKLRRLKSKKSEELSENTSLSSSMSDISRSRTSLQDIKGLLPFSKNKPSINRSSSEGCGMATLLVSSIIRGSSLQSISEGHDGDTQSIELKNQSKCGSLSTMSSPRQTLTRKKIKSGQASDISMSTTSISSSTTEEVTDEVCSDAGSEAAVPNEIVIVDADTVDVVVKSVLAHSDVDEDENEWIQPGTTRNAGSKSQLDKLSESNCKLHKVGSKISRSNEVSIPVNIGALQTVDQDAAAWIEPGSTTDEPEVDGRERRGSLLQELKENITEKIHSFQEHMRLPHLIESKHKSHHPGLLETAMETMLIDKVNILGMEPMLNSPELQSEIDERSSTKSETPASTPTKLNRPSLRRFNFSLGRKKKKDGELKNNTGLVGSAMQAMLLEQVNLAEEFAEFPTNSSHAESNSETCLYADDTSGYNVPRIPLTPVSAPPFLPSNIFSIINKPAPLAEAESTELERFTIPAISLTEIQSPTHESTSYYSSEPQLSRNVDSSPKCFNDAQFISLTNLKLNVNAMSEAPLQLDNNNAVVTNLSPSSIQTSVSKSESSQSYTPSMSPSPYTSLPVTPVAPHSAPLDHLSRSSFVQDNNLQIARNNMKSSSYTNLSTNKAPMLVPSPFLEHNRSELASVTASPRAAPLQQQQQQQQIADTAKTPIDNGLQSSTHTRTESVGGKSSTGAIQSPAKVCNNSVPVNTNNAKKENSEIYRRSSDSDLSVTPKGNSICVASDRLVTATALMRLSGASKNFVNQENLDMLEYPFLTMSKYPTGFIVHIGATVAARSVKLLERVPNPDEPEVRDSWWKELRMEVRSHARSLGCNVVLGYTEVTAISDEVCVLSATGTAAVINMSYNSDPIQLEAQSSSKKDLMVSSLEENRNSIKMQEEFSTSLGSATKGTISNSSLFNYRCFMCHVPYSQSSVPFNVKMKKCAVCKRGKVPDVLLATIEIPECLQITGRGCFIQAQVVRAKKDLKAESNAKEISDGLPFLEYELHRLLINKLKVKGMNAIFGLKTQVAVGEKLMALIATGTAVYLSALPPSSCPKIVAGNSWTDTAKLNELQKSLLETFERNREMYCLKCIDPDLQNGKQSDTDESEDEMPEMDLTTGGKDACVLEIDDIEDLEIITLLMESMPPDGYYVVNTQKIPGLQELDVVKNLQMFTQVWRAKFILGHGIGHFSKHFNRILQTIYFKLRTLIPCAICDLTFKMELPESDEIQLLVTGMALGLGEPTKMNRARRKTISSGNGAINDCSTANFGGGVVRKQSDEELIFSLDEDQPMPIDQAAVCVTPATPSTPQQQFNFGGHSLRIRKTSPCRTPNFNPQLRYSRHLPVHDRYGVDLTPLSYVAGGKIEKYLGNLNFFFIRESTSVRENGGISGFVHGFITEILAVVRAHVTALGGNAMVSFYMTELLLVDNQHKNQGQCLISVGGDAVYVSYYGDD